MIALGCDHGGFNLISAIKKHFDEQGIAYKDFGTFSEDSVDYPFYACKFANAVVIGECELCILFCFTG
ncbi:MAG: RpiB/LacA/LacB family sugar-phosphate isomerase, partial [Ruminococcus sp.]|nr:RpiB/LacA/LacB family sugar-phosphate isomerase [Ruminococcus sp.]